MKVAKFGREHKVTNKIKRKEHENRCLKVEIAKREKSIANNFTYRVCVGTTKMVLMHN